MAYNNELLRSLTKNEQKPIETKVKGKIPEWLKGTLFRNGPGRYIYGDKSYKHLFDGQACVHKFKIEDEKILYSNRFLDTYSYRKNLKENRLYAVFGTIDVRSTIFERLKTAFSWPITLDNVNVNIVPFGNENLYALTELNVMYEINPSTLETMTRIDINKYIRTATTTFAHPHYLNDGSWLTMGMNTKTPLPRYEFLRFRKTSKNVQSKIICEQSEVVASIPSSHFLALSYFHSFGLTKNYIVFLEQSLKFDLKKFFACLVLNKAYSSALTVKENFLTRIYLIDRNTGKCVKQKYLTDPILVFHHINSYEIYDLQMNIESVIVDVCAYDPKHFDIKKFTHENMYTDKLLETDTVRSIARRIIVPINKTTLEKEIYCEIKDLNSEIPFELPIINYNRYNGLPYKFMYGVNYYKLPFSIIKMNMQNPSEVIEMKYGQEGQKCLPSEPIFVESIDPTSEDDGVLLVMVLSETNDFLSILNAKDLKELARAELPEDVKAAFTFHGFFAEKSKFEKLNN